MPNNYHRTQQDKNEFKRLFHEASEVAMTHDECLELIYRAAVDIYMKNDNSTTFLDEALNSGNGVYKP